MKNLKIRVASESESKEAQELLDVLGYSKDAFENKSTPCWIAICDGLTYSDYNIGKNIWYTARPKEITLQELRDMVNQEQDDPFLTPETTLNDQYAEIEQVRKHRHYFKDVSNIAEIDVYAVLKLFDVTDPCLQHIVKKALCAGKRGHKDMMEDLQNIVDTAIRAVELNS